MANDKEAKNQMTWEPAKTFSSIIFIFIFGLTQLDYSAATEALWHSTQVPTAQLNGLNPLGSHVTSSRIHCAAVSSLNPNSHLMTYKEGVCTLYDLKYQAIQNVIGGAESVTCYTDKKGCEYNGQLIDENQIIETDCDTFVCNGSELILQTPQSKVNVTDGYGTCSEPFFNDVSVGCVMVLRNMTMIHCKSKRFCASLGAQLLVPNDVAAMKQFIKDFTLSSGVVFFIGVEDRKWLDGTPVDSKDVNYVYSNDDANCGGLRGDGQFYIWPCSCAAYLICQRPMN